MGKGQSQITGCGSKLRLVRSESSGTGDAVRLVNVLKLTGHMLFGRWATHQET
ncbi:hypothetical protein HanXRQr2_Chr08g0349011 [Helianthus annuus]|uniref:Uncharacterized protein n=1 Tax=Helianthus annuus TaxID=4232 RepID=A0A251UAF0_HELAN|nr:hypothetical protein HanXRQr2_Chr08g0349011 [Helianthus annuus]KAJ0902461.1 hypothetical protein HanPSC8_Chr08g0337311 [Helianthus annuus]